MVQANFYLFCSTAAISRIGEGTEQERDVVVLFRMLEIEDDLWT